MRLTVMRGEIMEQPAAVARLAAQRERFKAAAGEARASGARFVLYAARGTSDNAAVYGKYLATIRAGMPAGLAVPSAVTVYHASIDLRDCLVIGISQSGETPDVTEYLAAARRAGSFTVAVCNEDGSQLAKVAHVVLATGAGRERAVAATKTYTSQLAALALFWAAWKGDDRIADHLSDAIPAAMTAALACEPQVAETAACLGDAERLIVAARGYDYSTALETALKVKETCYVAAMPFSAADLMHGPIAMVEPDYPILLLASSGRAAAGMLSLQRELSSRGAATFVVAEAGARVGGARVLIEVPPVADESLSPLVAVLPGQLLALHLSLARGHDPDRPRSLSKVTRTW